MAGRRVLITGVGSYLGTELARRLERDPQIDYVAGLDTRPPRAKLERTDFIEADIRNPVITKLLPQAEVDTVVHNQIVRRPGPGMSSTAMHDVNVIGSLQLLAACEKADTVRAIGRRLDAIEERLPAKRGSSGRSSARKAKSPSRSSKVAAARSAATRSSGSRGSSSRSR